MKRWKERARQLRTELYALYLAARHPRTPWYAKLVVAGFVAYALTPVDLMPDAFPVLGFIDDLVFVPIAIALAVRFVPSPVLTECRRCAEAKMAMQRSSAWPFLLAAWAALAAAGMALYR